MSGIIAPAPIRKSIHVSTTPPHAFKIFTAGMARWWIKTHSINPTKSAIKDVVIEPHTGGRWFERGDDGSECDWGKVLAWEPPTRLLLAWQIDGQFRFDPALTTEVEIRFIPAESGTRVELEHRQLERLGEKAAAIHQIFDSDCGWSALLDSFAKATRAIEEQA
jgi:uncharacterized protein YndB with AHSA1/START domain